MSVLRRLEGEAFSEIVPEWKGIACVVIGCGPSLTWDQVEIVRRAHADGRCRVIAVNDAYLWASFADILYFADARWAKWHSAGIAKPALGMDVESVRYFFSHFKGDRCSTQDSAKDLGPSVHILRNPHFPHRGLGLSRNPRFLVTGFNSGFQAMNLAILAGAAPAILLGFDGAPARDGKSNFHGAHPIATSPEAYPTYRRAMSAAEHDVAELGVRIINATPGSSIDAWPKMALEDALDMVPAC